MNSFHLAFGLFLTLSISVLSGCKKPKDDEVSEQYTVTTLAGNGIEGYVDGPGSSAQFGTIPDITADGQGNIYVIDLSNYAIRKVTHAGFVSTLSGGNGKGYLDGEGADATFIYPTGIAVDGQGNLYVIDNYRIRKITPEGFTTTLAGGETRGSIDGDGTTARFNDLISIIVDSQGNIYVVENGLSYNEESKIRKITPSGSVSTFIIDPTFPKLIYKDNVGNIYALNGYLTNEMIMYSSTGIRTVIRSFPEYTIGIVGDQQGNFYFTTGGVFNTSNESKVFMYDASGKKTTIAGTGLVGFADGKGNVAKFDYPSDLAIDAQGNIYVADVGNRRIRKISK
jgi:sugar lactone lactonase YvrE